MRFLAIAALLAGCTGVSSDPGVGEVVAQSSWPMEIAIGGDNVYFIDGAAGPAYKLMRTSKQPGGTPEIIGNNAVITAITTDSHGVYWLGQDNAYCSLYAWSPGDSAPRNLGTNDNWGNGSTLRNIVSDGNNLYYTDYTGTIWKVEESGNGFVELGKTDTTAGSVALGPGGLWVTTLHGVKLLRTDGTSQEFAVGDDVSSSLAFDEGTLFLAYSGSGSDDGYIRSYTLASGATAMVAERLMLPSSMIAVNGELYFTTGNNDAAVRAVAYEGGRADAVAVGRMPSGVAIDDSYVYWSDWHPGEIRRVPR